MVAHTETDNNTNSTSPPINNYLIPSLNMNLPQNLLHPIDLWTKYDVQKWIEYCIDEYSLGDINLTDFQLNGKALLLLNEDSFKQRSTRSGDILHKALQQHSAILKSLNYQAFPYQFWNHFGLLPPSSTRHFNIPPFYPTTPGILSQSPMACMYPGFSYMLNRPETMIKSSAIQNQTDYFNSQQAIRTREISASSSSSTSSIKIPHKSLEKAKTPLLPVPDSIDIKHEAISTSPPITAKCLDNEDRIISSSPSISPKTKQQPNDVTNTRQIRYYHDRIDFHGDILLKPPGAKNCRILWEFLFILLEDPHYQTIIHWENREKMIFRIIQADKLAALWGLQKNRLSMTYEKLSRGMRYYYSNNIITKEQSKRLLYRFMRSPDEIRKSVKRNCGTTNMIYSTIDKKPSFSLQSITNLNDQETNLDQDDRSSQINNQVLQFLSAYSSSCTAIISNSTNTLLFDQKSTPISKSDRSSSSSPESFDSSRDSEKQCYTSSQSLSSTKRKQAVPTRLLHGHLVDQPLNLAVHKGEKPILECKKQKLIHTPFVV